MGESVDEPPTMVLVDKTVLNQLLTEQDAQHNREMRVMRVALITASLGFIAALIMNGFHIASLMEVSEQRSREIHQLERQASALQEQNDSIEDQNEAIMESLDILRNRNIVFDGMIVQMDCNMREVFQEVIEQIPSAAGQITVLTTECEELPE